jgi:ankyrin repeat protein
MDTALAKRWGLVMYLPDGDTQRSEQDTIKQNHTSRLRLPWVGDGELTKSQKQELRDWKRDRLELTRKDMRQFFRAGFRQVQDPNVVSLQVDWYFYLFLVPSYLDHPLLSHEEALEREVVEPLRPTKQSKIERLFLEKTITWCSKRNELLDAFQRCHLPVSEIPQYQDIRETLQQALSGAQSKLEQCQETLRQIGGPVLSAEGENLMSQEELNALRQDFEPLFQIIEALRQKMADAELAQSKDLECLRRTKIESMSKEIQDFDERVRSEVTTMINQQDGGPYLILRSDAIHACACNLQSSLIELFLEFIPSQEAKQQAINHPDRDGQTPLMVAAAMLDQDDRQYQTCELLLSLGANKSFISPSGHTALGKARMGQLAVSEFNTTFGLPRNSGNLDGIRAMETLLRPLMGPTAADDALLEDNEDTSTDSSMMFEDDDEE